MSGPQVEVLDSAIRTSEPAGDLIDSLRNGQVALRPMDPRVLAFTSDLSRALRRHPGVGQSPALGALAYWIRSASLRRLDDDWRSLERITPHALRVPRGVVFHMPPTNVDTLFVYSWLLSALMGNANVVRLSSTAVDASPTLLSIIHDVLASHPDVARSTRFVTYGHEEAITSALSQADVRVIWGGDETVQAVRRIPAGPHTRDLAFPDRYSYCVMAAESVAHATGPELEDLAHRFFNDAFWFDQMGCASPRLLVWRGDEQTSEQARRRFRSAVAAQLAERHTESTAASVTISKLVHAIGTATRGGVVGLDWSNNALTSVSLDSFDSIARDAPGGGLFYEITVPSLDELVGFVRRKDQTISTFGLDHDEITRFVEQVGARGVDRIVEVGSALTFGRFWDGVDLLTEFTRIVHVSSD